MPHLRAMNPLEQLRAGRLPLRLLQLAAGLSGYGFGLAMVIKASLGVAPWNVLEIALADTFHTSIGTMLVIVSAFVLALWIPLRQLPGLGTVVNSFWIGPAVDVAMNILPTPEGMAARLFFLLAGIIVNGAFCALYVGALLGAGPRDGLMTGLHDRFGWPVARSRTIVEVSVLIAGVILGGPVGIGTVAYAFGMGPVTQWFLRWCIIRLPEPKTSN